MDKRRNERIQRMQEKLSKKKGEKTICLFMIVKNEGQIIERCLDSVKTIIDYVSIVDTGSTDDTAEKIEQWCEKNGIPGTVHHEPFVNFAHNRTHSAKMAHLTYPMADFILTIDADMLMVILPGFDKRLMFLEKYNLIQVNAAIRYSNTRILNNKYEWTCVGKTHEYWADPPGVSVRTGNISSLEIDDRGDGGCKSDKFVRDKRLLKEGLEDPKEEAYLKTRYKFYLGETCRNLGELDEAIQWYQQRIDDGGWYEENFYARYRIGNCYSQKFERVRDEKRRMESDFMEKFKLDLKSISPEGLRDRTVEEIVEIGQILENYKQLEEQRRENFDKTVEWLNNATEYRPQRAEAIYALTKFYREQGMNREAYDLAIKGRKIKIPKDDGLFIEYPIYEYLFIFEISIAAGYFKEHKEEGKEAIIALLEMENLPEDIRRLTEHNSQFYL